MTGKFLAATAIAFLLSTTAARADCTPKKQHDINAAMEYVRNNCAADKVGICMGVMDLNPPPGTTLIGATQCFGTRNGVDPALSTTLFQVGSVSKVFTTSLLALRAVQGRVSLTDDIHQFVPYLELGVTDADLNELAGLNTIRLEDLADHHSGLPKELVSGDDIPTLTAELQGCLSDPINCWNSYGDFRYSNTAVSALGNAMQTLDNTPWETDIRNSIMLPLGMTETTIMSRLKSSFPNDWAERSCGFASDDPSTMDCQSFPDEPASPAGGFWSNAEEMLLWLSDNMIDGNPSDIDQAFVLAHTSRADGHCNGFNTSALPNCDDPGLDAAPGTHEHIGLGWNLDEDNVLNVTRISKDGDTALFHAYVAFTKDGQRGVFVLLNNGGGTDREVIGNVLLESLP